MRVLFQMKPMIKSLIYIRTNIFKLSKKIIKSIAQKFIIFFVVVQVNMFMRFSLFFFSPLKLGATVYLDDFIKKKK